MLTSLLRTRPVLGYSIALVVSAFVALVGVGGALSADSGSAGTAVFLAFIGGVGIVMLVGFATEAVQQSRRPFGHVGTSPSGAVATVLPYAATGLAATVSLLVLAALASVAGLVVALADGEPVWVAICVVVGVLALGALAPVLLGGVRPGGLFLTPDGVEQRRMATGWRVRWDDVEAVAPQDPVPVLTRSGADVRRERTAPFGWSGDVRGPDGVLGVDTRHLSVDAETLAHLLAAHAQQPELRPRLGTATSLEGLHRSV